MKLVHINWQLVGSVGVIDDDGEMQILGTTQDGQPVKQGNINVSIARFRGNEVEAAYLKARELCDQVLANAQPKGPSKLVETPPSESPQDSTKPIEKENLSLVKPPRKKATG